MLRPLFPIVLLVFTLSLQAQNTDPIQLQTVQLSADPDAWVKEIMSRARLRAQAQRGTIKRLRCTTHVKSSFVSMGQDHLLEFVADSWVRYPLTHRDVILAINEHKEGDLPDFGNTMEVSIISEFGSSRDDIVPTSQSSRRSSDHWIQGLGDADLNLWQQSIHLSRFMSQPIVSPLAVDASWHYRFWIANDSLQEEGLVSVHFQPKVSGKGLSGTLVLVVETGQLKQSDILLPAHVLVGLDSVHVSQSYENLDPNINMPTTSTWTYRGPGGMQARVEMLLESHEVNPTWEAPELAVRSYAADAFTQDAQAWERIRRLPLTQEQNRHISYQDSLSLYHDSDGFKDSVEAVFNSFKWYKPLLTGWGYRNHRKGYRYYYAPLISQFRPMGIGGMRWNPAFGFQRKFNNDQQFTLAANLNYGFKNQDIKGKVEGSFMYDPKRFAEVNLSMGDDFMMLNSYESLLATFSRGNFARTVFFSGSHRSELVNGLYAKFSFDFSDRLPIENMTFADWSNELFGELNLPTDFEEYTVALVAVDLLYRHKQRYILKGNRKLILGSEYPDVRLKLSRGIPDFMGSDVDYSHLELSMMQDVNWPRMGYTYWRAGGGSFFTDDYSKVKLIEHRYFRGSDKGLFSDPLTSLQTLQGSYHTPKSYMELYAIHHFEGALLKWVPLINRMNLELAVGNGAVWTEEFGPLQVETYVGVERKFKLYDQTMRWGVYYVSRPGTIVPQGFKFKFGINTYDPYQGKWMY